MYVGHSPNNYCRTNGELDRALFVTMLLRSYRRGRGAKGYACGIALTGICGYDCYCARTGDRRVLGVIDCDRLVTGGCVAMIVGYCPGYCCVAYRELGRCIVRYCSHSAVVARCRGAKGYAGCIALTGICR